MSTDPEIVEIAEKITPDQVTLVPENRAELTTEGGLDCVKLKKRISEVTKRMHDKGILVSAFIVPSAEQISACAEIGCDAVELHTGMYANAETDAKIEEEIAALKSAKDLALQKQLIVHAGHGLTYRNIAAAAGIEDICEFNIGHSIIARSTMVGIREATERMIELIDKHSPKL
jgi:pyridoxine 5-phosphate synthase